MKFNLSISYILVFFLGMVLFSCEIETAQPSKQKQLTIVSDYLHAADTVVFSKFSKRKKIKVKIVHMVPSKIIGQYRKNRFNTGFDVIMLKSITDVIDFYKKDILHPLQKGTHYSEENDNHSSERYDYIGFGFDPFIVAVPKNQSLGIRMYNDLTRHKFSTNLSDNELIPMFAPILSKKNRIESNNWVKKFYDHSKRDSLYTDSIAQRMPILTTYSSFHAKENRSEFKDKTCVFPNTKSTGTFYNLRTICVVNQAEHFDEAAILIQYLLSDKNNRTFNKKLNTIGIQSNEIGFRKYYVNSEEMVQYYLTIERLIQKITD